MTADAAAWRVWFLQLSGWPVFLAILAVTALLMLGVSMFLTRIANRSVWQNLLLAVAGLVLVACLILVGLRLFSDMAA